MASTHSRIVHAWRPAIDIALSGIMSDPAVQIAGRDGSMSLATPGCTFLDPPTGAAISANRAYNLVGPGGLTLPMYTAFPAIVNLCPVASGAGVGLASNTLSGLARTITESAAASDHYLSTTISTDLPDNTQHIIRCIVYRKPGSLANRHAALRVFSGANAGGMVVDLDTGICTLSSGGTVTASAATSVAIGSGRWLVSYQITSTNFGASQALLMSINENGSTFDANFSGDGVSGIVYEAVTLVASALTPLGIAEAATRAADDSVWTPTSVPAVCDIAQLIARPYKAAYANNETFLYGGTTGQPSLSAAATPSFTATGLNTAAASKSASGTAGIVAAAKRIELVVSRFTATGVSISINGGAFSAETAIANAPWVHDGTIRLNYSDGTRAPYALVSAMLRAGGLSDAQLNAMNLAYGNGRTVPVVA